MTHLKLEVANAIATVTLNRPEVRNAFNDEVILELTQMFRDLGARDDVRCIILAAAGTAYCAGADLNWMKRMADYTREQNLADAAQLGEMLHTIDQCPKPTIARVQGDVYAGGTGLVANAHVAIAHPDSRFGLPEVKIGLWPLLVYRAVASAIGQRRATEWSLTGRMIRADEALGTGLITELHEAPEQRAREIALAIAAYRRDAISVGLEYVNGDQSGDRARQLRATLI